jgi:hypothetical protein
MEWLGPEDAWPVHQRKEAQDALADAKGQGWSLVEFSAHAFGKIRCPHHNEPACEVTIFTSGRGDKSGAATAKVIHDGLRTCKNRGGATDRPAPSNPHEAILRAERLTVAAERLRRSEWLRLRSDERIARAEETAESGAADRFLDEAYEADQRASVEDSAARADASRFGLGDPWPPADGAAELRNAAQEQFEIAAGVLSRVENSEEFEVRLQLLKRRLSEEG